MSYSPLHQLPIKSEARCQTLILFLLSLLLIYTSLNTRSVAANLGKINVQSHLGQPLRAEIALSQVTTEEEKTIIAKLASASEYEKAELDFNPILLSLQFSIEAGKVPGEKRILITSTKPINDPFLDVLLDLSGTDLPIIREYSVLLDPADIFTKPRGNQQPLTTQVPFIAPSKEGAALPYPMRFTPNITYIPKPGQSNMRRPEDYRIYTQKNQGKHTIQKGEVLSNIALKHLRYGITLNQMLVALYRANEQTFDDHNMNRMRTGKILTIPHHTVAGHIPVEEANVIVVKQMKDFRSYSQALAKKTSEVAGGKNIEQHRHTAKGKVTTQVVPNINDKGDRLKLSPTQLLKSTEPNSGKTDYVKQPDEENIAHIKAMLEAESRVRALEKNLANLKHLLEIKNERLAALEQQQAPSKKQVPAEPKAQSKNKASPVLLVEQLKSKSVEKAQETLKVQQKPVQIPEKTEISFFKNPLTLLLGGLLLSGLTGLGIYRFYKKNQHEEEDLEENIDEYDEEDAEYDEEDGNSLEIQKVSSPLANEPPTHDIHEKNHVVQTPAEMYMSHNNNEQEEDLLKTLHSETDSTLTETSMAPLTLREDDFPPLSLKVEKPTETNSELEKIPDPLPDLVINKTHHDNNYSTPHINEMAVEDTNETPSPKIDAKIELALAYQKMGDTSGARELLGDVLGTNSDASTSQIVRVRQLLNELP